MTTLAADAVATTRLLRTCRAGTGPSLRAHHEAHGPLEFPAGHLERWAGALVEEIHASGLTGRGGAGFPTARKLTLLAAQRRRPLVVVNAMEGEPASAKDRVLLEEAPHLVIDGALAVALAVGAGRAVVCLSDDRPATATAVRRALDERGRALPLDVQLLQPPARYAAGEESALVDWVAGGAGLPRFRLDKSTPLAARRVPVLLQNAETLAHVALIARHGARWFRSAGLAEAPGTTLVTVSGSVPRPGVFEVALGTPLRAVLEGAGTNEVPAAVLLGGYGGAFVPGRMIEVPYTNGALGELGASVGAGVVAVLHEGVCGVAETARVVSYLAGESAGQCGPCVNGLPAIAADLRRLAAGDADGRLLDRIAHRLELVEGRGACRLPDGAVRLTRSALAVFAEDVRAHARHRPCPAWNRRPVLPTTAHRREQVV